MSCFVQKMVNFPENQPLCGCIFFFYFLILMIFNESLCSVDKQLQKLLRSCKGMMQLTDNMTSAQLELAFKFFGIIPFPGAMSGGFSFQVNDGENFTPRQIFSITAKALVLSLEKNRPLKVFPGKSVTPLLKRFNVMRL